MPLVKAVCTNCNAPLSVDNEKDAAICPYCGTPYVIQKAINKYNNTYNITTPQLNITIPTESENSKANKMLNKAKTYKDFGEYDNAHRLLCQASEKYPEECSIWIALLEDQIEFMRREKTLGWQNIGYNYEGTVWSFEDLIKKIKITGAPQDIVHHLERRWSDLLDEICKSIKSGSTDYFMSEKSKLYTERNGLQYYEYVEFPFKYEKIRNMHPEFLHIFTESKNNSKKISDAGLYFGCHEAKYRTLSVGWWPILYNNKFSHSIIWNRYIFFEKRMDSEGWGIPCMIAFDKPIEVNDAYLASISASRKKNMYSLEQCPFCGSHKLKQGFWSEGRKCSQCKEIII